MTLDGVFADQGNVTVDDLRVIVAEKRGAEMQTITISAKRIMPITAVWLRRMRRHASVQSERFCLRTAVCVGS